MASLSFVASRNRWRAWVSGGYLLVAMALAMAALSFAFARPSSAVELKDLPDGGTVGTNGRVSAVLTVGDRIYIAGSFTQVIRQDGTSVSRPRLAAIDATTGQLTDWAPRANSRVLTLAASPDGNRIYAGGEFTAVSGRAHNRLAAISAATGAVDNTWNPSADLAVRSLAVSGSNVYLGGDFGTVNGDTRSHLALVDGVTGTLNPIWNPAANGVVRALTFSPDGTRLYAGGQFTNVSGQFKRNLVALDPASGAPETIWSPNPARPIFDLAVDSARVYAAEGGGGGAVSAYSVSSLGSRAWSVSADGDVQAIALLDGKVYAGGHFLVLDGQRKLRIAALDADTGTLDPTWTARTSGGVWTVTEDSSRNRLYIGGDFSGVTGQTRQKFAQFSV